MSMDQIQDLYEAITRADKRLKAAGKELEAANKDYERLSSDLGDVLHVLGLSEIKMHDGKTLGLKTEYFGSAAQERMADIKAFLEAQNNAGILKPKKLNITEDMIDKLPDELKDAVMYEINANTLKAYFRELAGKNQMDQAVRELFKIHQENKVVLK